MSKQLPAEMLDKIQNDAKRRLIACSDSPFNRGYYSGEISGATAYATQLHEANERERVLVEALREIAESNCDYESTGYVKSIHSPECKACRAKQALAQYEGKKEVGDE